MAVRLLAAGWLVCIHAMLVAAEPYRLPFYEVVPLPHDEASFNSLDAELTRWRFGDDAPRPYFYPFRAYPEGATLTRMGHPGADNHSHHRSIWFAHQDVNGINFWTDHPPEGTGGLIRQKQWYAYEDGNDEAVMACWLQWLGPDGDAILDQDLVAAVSLERGGCRVELQSTFRVPKGQETVILGKTNFGILGVRVAKTISEWFGAGRLTSSEGAQGEEEIFGKRARWMDYSGPVRDHRRGGPGVVTQGITYFDHPGNIGYPAHWHVRQDGWMGASLCMQDAAEITADQPLTLRYLLHGHPKEYQHELAQEMADAFAERPPFLIRKSPQRHRQYEVIRDDESHESQ